MTTLRYESDRYTIFSCFRFSLRSMQQASPQFREIVRQLVYTVVPASVHNHTLNKIINHLTCGSYKMRPFTSIFQKFRENFSTTVDIIVLREHHAYYKNSNIKLFYSTENSTLLFRRNLVLPSRFF